MIKFCSTCGKKELICESCKKCIKACFCFVFEVSDLDRTRVFNLGKEKQLRDQQNANS